MVIFQSDLASDSAASALLRGAAIPLLMGAAHALRSGSSQRSAQRLKQRSVVTLGISPLDNTSAIFGAAHRAAASAAGLGYRSRTERGSGGRSR